MVIAAVPLVYRIKKNIQFEGQGADFFCRRDRARKFGLARYRRK